MKTSFSDGIVQSQTVYFQRVFFSSSKNNFFSWFGRRLFQSRSFERQVSNPYFLHFPTLMEMQTASEIPTKWLHFCRTTFQGNFKDIHTKRFWVSSRQKSGPSKLLRTPKRRKLDFDRQSHNAENVKFISSLLHDCENTQLCSIGNHTFYKNGCLHMTEQGVFLPFGFVVFKGRAECSSTLTIVSVSQRLPIQPEIKRIVSRAWKRHISSILVTNS